MRVRIAIGAVAVAVALVALVVVGSRDVRPADASREDSGPRPTRRVEQLEFLGKAITVRQVDPRRGLIYELESTPKLRGNGVTVKLTDDAPAATREAVRTHILGASCDVKGQDVHEFVGRWDERFDQFGTELYTDDRSVVIADEATSCFLHVGQPTGTPGEETFKGPPFSRVRMR
jgi:hypothetical protein